MYLFNNELLNLLQSFETNKVKYLIVGGFAVNRYGYKRTTGDIDFYIKDDTENRNNLVKALAEMGYGELTPLLTVPIIAGYCEIMMDNGMYADLMAEIPGLDRNDFDLHYDMATVDSSNGFPIRFLHYNHLLENKQKTARNKDILDIEELRKINETNKDTGF